MRLTLQTELQVHLHLSGGDIVSFATDDNGTIDRLFEQAWRGRVFSDPSLIIARAGSVEAVPGETVVRLDFIADLPPDGWSTPEDETESRPRGMEITAEEWQAGIVRRAQAQEAMNVENSSAYARLQLRTGAIVYLQVTMATPNVNEQRRFLQHVFTNQTMPFQRAGGGFSLLSPKHIVRATFHPGIDLPAGAWHARSEGA